MGRMSVENRAMGNVFHEDLVRQIEPLLKIKDLRIDPLSFNQKHKIYPNKEVENDINDSQRRDNKYNSEISPDKKALKNKSKITEFLIYKLIDQKNILGPNFKAFLPSLYDDQINKTDIIVEYKINTEPGKKVPNQAFVVDITNSETEQINKLKGLLYEKNLIAPKYYIPEGQTKIKSLPIIILKIDTQDLEKLLQIPELIQDEKLIHDDILNKTKIEAIKKIKEKISKQLLDVTKNISAYFKDKNTNASMEYSYLNSNLKK